MNAKQILAVRKLLRRHLQKRRLNPTWQSIVDEHGIGTIRGQDLLFTKAELRSLEQLVERDTGINPMLTDLNGDRLAAASVSHNEKLSTQAVFSDLIWLNTSCSGLVQVAGDAVVTPPGAFAAVPADQLVLSEHVSIVVVENGAAFRNLHQAKLPSGLDDFASIYRGHGAHQRQVLDLVQDHRRKGRVIGFFDFDPAGVCLGLEIGITHILVPTLWRQPVELDRLKRFNKAQEYVKQQKKLRDQAESLTGPFRAIADAVLHEGWSLTQEHMISHQLDLELLPVNGG